MYVKHGYGFITSGSQAMNRHDSRDRSRRSSLRGSPLVYGRLLLPQLLSYQMLLLRECTGNRLTTLCTRIIVYTIPRFFLVETQFYTSRVRRYTKCLSGNSRATNGLIQMDKEKEGSSSNGFPRNHESHRDQYLEYRGGIRAAKKNYVSSREKSGETTPSVSINFESRRIPSRLSVPGVQANAFRFLASETMQFPRESSRAERKPWKYCK